MWNQKIIPFKITSMDSLGQGVSKESDRITFIPKTAIGDEGDAVVLSEKKGVSFASVKTLKNSSPLRIQPLCPHFEQCPSCHYLHLPYDEELKMKQESLQKLFRKLPIPEIQTIGAIRRLAYRNRIQLHFRTSTKKLGMLDARSQQIIPIPECLIAIGPVKAEVERLYKNDEWLKEAPSLDGHLEIYWVNGEVKKSWNQAYAQGGFTQVFDEMNQKLKIQLKNWSEKNPPSHIVDLFAGAGNLSEDLGFKTRLCVDYYTKNMGPDALSLDLYSDHALKRVIEELTKRSMKAEHLILDPPRSGLKNLASWLEQLKPTHVAYVSCDPHTLVRDITSISGYSLKELWLIDFFPSTFHYETLIILERIR